MFKLWPLGLLLIITTCGNAQLPDNPGSQSDQLMVGAEQTASYFPLLRGKKIGVLANQTSMIGNRHLVDSLMAAKIQVLCVFGPEHGFRGNAGNGESVVNDKDIKTGLTVVSLYGEKKKPDAADLQGLDLVVFDIQDVGARFYTYISTLSLLMEACAENHVSLLILDRPNPHGDYVDGPVLEKEYASFVGMHPVPVVHGMTVGEYALMVNGEGWLKGGLHCDLDIIPVKNYTHSTPYVLPVAPSPNLPNADAVALYPSLCFFEGTIISVARGTDFPFQAIGHPDYAPGSFSFTPESIPGVASHPPYEGQLCYGQKLNSLAGDWQKEPLHLHLEFLIGYYNYFKGKRDFFTPYFEKLAGTGQLRQQIETGLTEEQIRASWQEDLIHFKSIRKKYLLYAE